MAPGGSTDTSSMLWELLARPSQLSLLLRLAADAYARSAPALAGTEASEHNRNEPARVGRYACLHTRRPD